MTQKQKEVMRVLQEIQPAKALDIYNKVDISYFHNSGKHFGALLKRMTEQGYITRSRPDGSQNPRGAFYSISKKGRIKRGVDTPNPNQQKLFL